MQSKRIVFSPRAYHSFIDRILEVAEPVSPRGITTLELVNSTLVVRNIRDRVVADRGRGMNIAFAFAEWYAMMYGVESLGFFERFVSNYAKYSSDGVSVDGAYGTRVHYPIVKISSHGISPAGMANQLESVIAKLRSDSCSRQAVIAIYNADDVTIGGGGKNTPCTLTLQFLIRDGQLHLIVNMRSSDVYIGLTYDVFVFTMLQEYVARELDVPTGLYFHNAGSLHAYESDFSNFKKLSRIRWPQLMRVMPKISDDDRKGLNILIGEGKGLDVEEKVWFNRLNGLVQSDYVRNIANCMKSFVDRERDPSLSVKTYYAITDQTIKYVLRSWLVKAGMLEKRG